MNLLIRCAVMSRVGFAVLGSTISITGCALHSQSTGGAPLSVQDPLPALAASFVTETARVGESSGPDAPGHGVRTSAWEFWRQPGRIENRMVDTNRGEVWLRDGKTFFYQKLFHGDRKIVEYRQEDLNALHIPVAWNAKAMLLDPGVLQRLQVLDRHVVGGHPAVDLSGAINNVRYEVVWLTDLALPYRVVKRDAAGNVETTRLAATEAPPLTRLTPPDARIYEVIDYSDLGDRERDPFVMKIQHDLPGVQVHSHKE